MAAKFVIKNPKVIINSVDLSGQVETATLTETYDEVEVTAFGDTAHSFLTGLSKNQITLGFYQDFSASSVHATIGPLVGSTTSMTIRPTANATATSNPAFTFTVLVSQYTPLDAQMGNAAKISATWPVVSGVTEADS